MSSIRVECGCGFAVEGTEAEVVSAAQRHARERHEIDVSDSMIVSLAQTVDDADDVDEVDLTDERVEQ